MRVGVVFPQTESGDDPGFVRDFAQAAEGLGFAHLVYYDHVLGAVPEREPRLTGPYTHETIFHEPMVAFGYLAGVTSRIELVTGILILPQRQTALVAKQAAEVDLLSGGRLRLGVGTGWNYVEYDALGENFHNRGRRQEEQVALLRALWGAEVVDFEGKWHRVDRAGIRPLPKRQIPIWFGGYQEVVFRRAARLGDGFIFGGPQGMAMAARLREWVAEAGRDPAAFGIEGNVGLVAGPEKWSEHVAGWRDAGATHLSLRTMGSGLATPADHIAAMERWARETGALAG